jgi:digeranylgeranylglycerophospholipid reductase
MVMMQQKDQQTDVAIIGAGPAGSYTALRLALLGVKTDVYEEHTEIGVPSHCAGHISIRSLKALGYYPLPQGIIENTFNAANFYSPTGVKFSIRLKTPVTCVLNRTKFDQHIAKQAQQAGAIFHLNSPVESLQIENNYVKGLNLKDHTTVSSKITIDAEGISSRLLRQTKLRGLEGKSLVYAVEAEIDQVYDIEPHAVEVYMGSSTPGFYGWLIPRPDGSAKLGLATNQGNPQTCLKHLMTKHPIAKKQVKEAKIVRLNYHAIPLAGPINRAYGNGFLAVGDVASQVKPTTGGGIIFGLTCGEIAAKTAKYALDLDNVSAKTLSTYQKHCNKMLNFDISFMLRLRQFLNTLSDKRWNSVLRFCNRFGVDKALSEVEEIDYQGKMIMQVATKPAMLTALGYFGLLYLLANP